VMGSDELMNLTWTIALPVLCTAAALTAGLVTGYAWGASERREERAWESIADAPGEDVRWPGKAAGSPGLMPGNSDGRTRCASQGSGSHAGRSGLPRAVADLPGLPRGSGGGSGWMAARLKAGR